MSESPRITLTGHQLRQALIFCREHQSGDDTQIVLQLLPDGLYVVVAGYPEEGRRLESPGTA